MGDLQVCPPQPRGGDAGAAAAGYSAIPPHPPNPHPSTIGDSTWRLAEQATLEIIQHIQPTVVSEQRRKAVVEYVQKLIRGFLSSEVFPFGSVPLKTYLPDGDIDLTAIGIPSSEDSLALDVRSVLEVEEHNKDAEFKVKDVQFIHAEVKLVKCLVQNIVVDISFNQIGGLCTLCFLEQVDRLIGKDHLFKSSIILIKAWCYYESRILGAHHGLISTYALETLVLYIFHLFHSSLEGPLAVLYRFLDYYSKFDWDKYCISLRGPVAIASLPELSVEILDNDGGDLLLTEEFLRSCVDTFTAPIRGSESNSRTFIKKHLNIVDPLRENNNLGRSVSKGNFYRIRSAFTYGARKLGRTLLLPTGSIVGEVNLFFMNTMDRHGGGERPDVQDLIPRLLGNESVQSNGIDIVLTVEKLQKQKADKQSAESQTANAYRETNKDMKNIRISDFEEYEGQLQRTFSHIRENGSEMDQSSVEVIGVSSGRLVGDAKDLATASTPVSETVSESQKASASNNDDDILDFRKAHHAPHMFFLPENRIRRDLNLDPINSNSLGTSNVLSNRALSSSEEITNFMQPDSCETDSCETDSSLSSTYLASNYGSVFPSKTSHFADCDLEANKGNGFNGCSCLLNEMSDLSGDYEMHLSSLMYAQWCQEQIMGTYFLPVHRLPPYSYYHRAKDVRTNGTMFTPMNSNALSPRPLFSPTAYYSRNPPFISTNYGTEDSPKPRGTGTYFPNANYHVYKERYFPGRVKNAVSANNLPRLRNSGRADVSQDMSPTEKGSHEPAIPALPIFNGRGRPPALLHIPQSSSRPSFTAPPNANGIIFPADCSKLEFGSLGPVSVEVPTTEHSRKPDFCIAYGQGSGFTSTASSSQRPSMNSNRGRMSKSYQLKDEDDFPPLSS